MKNNSVRSQGHLSIRGAFIAFCAVLAVIVGVIVPASVVSAAEVEVIDVSSITFTNTIQPGNRLEVGQTSRVSFDWSLIGTGATAGDTFSLVLTRNFQAVSGTIDLRVAGGADSAGTCTLSPMTPTVGPKVVCVLSDYVDSHDDVTGSLWIEVQTVTSTTETSLSLTVDGNVVLVPIPPGGIGAQGYGPVPTNASKRGYWSNPERTAITWYVDVPGSFVGTTNPLEIVDTYSAGLTLIASGAQAPSFTSIEMTQAAWDLQSWSPVNPAQWELTPDVSQSFHVSLQQPIDQTRLYRFKYQTSLDYPENSIPGDVFSNVAVVNGTTYRTSLTYTTTGGGSAIGSGRGGFIVAKEALAGDGVSLVPAGTEYSVKATITEPFKAPREVELQLTAGGAPKGVANLPEGTTVTLSEINLPSVTNVSWGTPRFSANSNPNVTVSPDGSTVELAIVADGTYRFSLVNTAEDITPPPLFSVGDYTWVDLNADGLQDATEQVLPGVTVSLSDQIGDPVRDSVGDEVLPVVSDGQGEYHFDGLPAGKYRVHFEAPSGYELTSETVGADESLDSNADPATGWTRIIDLGVALGNTAPSIPADGVSAQYIDRTIDAGFIEIPTPVVPYFAVGDYAWFDQNADGLQTSGEAPMTGVLVWLVDSDEHPVSDIDGHPVAPVTTDSDGKYHFDRLPAGEYRVKFDAPSGMEFTSPEEGSDPTLDSRARDRGVTRVFELGIGLDNTTATIPGDDVTASYIDRTQDAGFVETVPVVNDGSVSIVKDDGRTIVKPGETLNYSLVVSNATPYAAPNVVVRDVMPSTVDLVSSSIPGTIAVDNPLALEWDLGDLPAGETRTIVVTVRVHSDLPAEAMIVNTATATSSGICADDPLTPVKDCESTDVDRTPTSIWVLKDDHAHAVRLGDSLTYDITVGNSSAVTKDAIEAVDSLPSSVKFVSATDGGKYDPATRSVSWTVLDLGPGQSRVVHVTVQVKGDIEGSVINTVILPSEPEDGCKDAEACLSADQTLVSGSLARTGGSSFTGPLLLAVFGVFLGAGLLVLRRRKGDKSLLVAR